MIFCVQAYGVLDDKKLGIPREVINHLTGFMSPSPETVKPAAVRKTKTLLSDLVRETAWR